MLSGIKIFSSDVVWRQILAQVGAQIVDAPDSADVNFDTLCLPVGVGMTELKAAVLAAADNTDIIERVFGRPVTLSPVQAQIVRTLARSGGQTVSQLKSIMGYAPDAATHTVETAIYQLRQRYGRDFIINSDGVYKIGKL